MKILVIDNYDSFTYNLVQMIESAGADTEVIKNDAITEDELAAKLFDMLLISPGPGKPKNSKLSISALKIFSGKKPILGVCLGHQVICEYFGGKVIKAEIPVHGYTSKIKHTGRGIFYGLPDCFSAMRYHSLAADSDSIPDSLVITAYSQDNIIMGVKHLQFNINGVQFHPESILTENGKDLIKNWLGRPDDL